MLSTVTHLRHMVDVFNAVGVHMFGALVKPTLSHAYEMWCPTVARRADLQLSGCTPTDCSIV